MDVLEAAALLHDVARADEETSGTLSRRRPGPSARAKS